MVKVRFQSSCPSCRNPDFYYWIHHNCGGDLYLDNYGKLICNNCFREDFIFRWKFDCGYRKNDAHKGGFEYGCLQGFYMCLSNLGKLQDPPENFILDVTQVLMDHKNEFKEKY
jgi:hypothetical protein